MAWYIPWSILLVGTLDLLLPHGIYHGIHQVFGIYHGVYSSQGVIYHGTYKFDFSYLTVYTNSNGI